MTPVFMKDKMRLVGAFCYFCSPASLLLWWFVERVGAEIWGSSLNTYMAHSCVKFTSIKNSVDCQHFQTPMKTHKRLKRRLILE